jgi:hypothetical protein
LLFTYLLGVLASSSNRPTGMSWWLWLLLCRRLFLTWAAATRANQPKENVVVDMLLAEYAENAVKVEVSCQPYWVCCSAVQC